MKRWENNNDTNAEFIRNNMEIPGICRKYGTMKVVYQQDCKEMYPNVNLWTRIMYFFTLYVLPVFLAFSIIRGIRVL